MHPTIRKVLADQGYQGRLVLWTQAAYGVELEIVCKPAEQQGFVPQPFRWVVERTIAWLNYYRGLAKDYERLPENSEAMIYLMSIHTSLKRLYPNPEVVKPYKSVIKKRMNDKNITVSQEDII